MIEQPTQTSDGKQPEVIIQKAEEGVPITESTLRLASNQYNQGTRIKQLIHEEYNSAINRPVIMERVANGTARDLDAEPKHDGEMCFIIGSGPSLDHSIEQLKDWEGGIICSTSHALTLMYYGIEPSHIMALDPFSLWEETKGVDWSKTRTKLITHPGVWPDLIENWPNEMLLYLQNSGDPHGFYNTAQKHMFTERTGDRNEAEFKLAIRTEVTLFACSPPAQMFAADRLGYGRIFLAGCDFAFHTDKERFTSYTVKREETTVEAGNAPAIDIGPQWVRNDHPFIMDEKEPEQADAKLLKTENGLWTRGIHLYYKRNMISAWRLSLQDVWTTDHGSITEMPYVDIEAVIGKKGDIGKAWTHDRIRKAAERYMAMMDSWVVESEAPDGKGRGGVNFLESNNPTVDIYMFMIQMRQAYRCTKCALELRANDHAEHDGSKCPRCGDEKGLTRSNDIDVRKNMNRIWNLHDWAQARKAKK